ncbi:hypothetical protein DY703_05120 [Salmonella enterica]|nr:hypothetical protein [Salmonella enterica]EBQ9478323.1 hypothetical protein [Salmonella enterica subsp. enterica serovar Kokomlemle]ECX4751459.1 hypothetical protein [Salmonella enterica]EGJ5835234.1 hypothetical protein [Salmonella enterica]EHQ5241558.1 hypothetical protein [Salmonella enterica]
MSKLTPVFKCCNEMTLISSWPESYQYTPEMSEALLLTRIFDVSACHYAQQFAQTYKDLTGYDLPFITLTDEEHAAINSACSRFIAETEEQKKPARKRVDDTRKKLQDIRSGVIRPSERYPLADMINDANKSIEYAEKHHEELCNKLDKKIRLLKSVIDVKHGDDFSHLMNVSLREFGNPITTRVNNYKSMFSALQRITTLNNETRFKIVPGSVAMRRSNAEAEFINERINQVTIDYYRSDNEALRNSLSLAEYTELHLLKFKEDAHINAVITLGINETVMN